MENRVSQPINSDGLSDERDSAIALLIRLGIWDNTDEAEMEKDISRAAQALAAARADERKRMKADLETIESIAEITATRADYAYGLGQILGKVEEMIADIEAGEHANPSPPR